MRSSALATLLCFLQVASAVPGPVHSGAATQGQSVPLARRQPAPRTVEDWAVWANSEREALRVKYGGPPLHSKRGQGTNLLINQNADASYVGSLAIGTPPVAFYVTLDTGSSDLWVTDVNCVSGCVRGSSYNPSSSSTSNNLSQPFSVTYGSGQVAGDLVSDVVQMAGFSVNNQAFGAVTQTTDGLLSSPASGLLGLGWQSNAASGQPPFWETLASKGAWSQPVMAFQLTRFVNDSNARTLEPGGSFTMGFLNTSLYTGSVDYRGLASSSGFWDLPLTGLTVQGNGVSIPSGAQSFAAIDTGTTLVGGPASIIQNVFAQIPGSQPGSGNWQGYWIYPCNTQVNVAMAFGGGPSWPISPSDFELTQIGPNACVGALFAINTQGNAPSWIVGDTFLKNVYSVFRYRPPSVGFAALSQMAVGMNGVNGPPPTATIGSVVASVTASGNATSGSSSLSLRRWSHPPVGASFWHPFGMVACGVAVGASMALVW